ncbi:MAG: orotidine-5'-phosphate decarboxylase [Bacteroidetes bacterium 4572_112]|nr:MAG: orotidine-5'-phosphate decarboxylase [Bacteroidetes bacterium 4572_112]
MTKQELFEQIKKKKSFLCVGLDSDINKIPKHLLDSEDPVFEFNKQIIDATLPYTVAYKPNIAFYESRGAEGWKSLEKTINYLKEKAPEAFTIADAKRGDIGNTSKMYAKAFLENMPFDSITVAPYMGVDSVSPFLEYDNKWVVLLALTSNKGAFDFQTVKPSSDKDDELYKQVLTKSQEWANDERIMYVVGATKAEFFTEIRKYVPEHFLLVPGVGAQGGSLSEVSKYGMNDTCGLLVNSSRGIIFASVEQDFAEVAASKAKELQIEMEGLLKDKGIL